MRDVENRLRWAEKTLQEILARVGQLNARSGKLNVPRQIRLAITCASTGGIYPSEGSNPNTYWIKFVDASYPSGDGAQTLTTTNRQAEPAALCHNIAQPVAYIPDATLIYVFRHNNKWYTSYAGGGSDVSLVRIEPPGSSGGSAQREGTPIWCDPVDGLWSARLSTLNATSLAYTESTLVWVKEIDLDPSNPSIVPLLTGDRFLGRYVGSFTDQFDFSRPLYAIRRERRRFDFELTTTLLAGLTCRGRVRYWNGSDFVMIGDEITLYAKFESLSGKVGDVAVCEFDPARGVFMLELIECS